MRQNEILSLWPNADLFRRTILVVKSKTVRSGPSHESGVFEPQGKGEIIRTNKVSLREAGTKILRRNLMRRFKREDRQDRRFPFSRSSAHFATRLAQAGIDLYQISKLLGHKDIKMTQRYAHHCPDSLRSGVEVLDKVITFLSQSNEKGLAV
jgi:integrase